MIALQHQTTPLQAELARVLRVTTQAWGLPEVGHGQARPWKLATRPPNTQHMPWQNNWSRVPVQSLRRAI